MKTALELLQDIGWQPVRRSGDELIGHCPNPSHDDKNPSFSINEKTGEFNCFSCELKGRSPVTLAMYIYNVDIEEAKRIVGVKSGDENSKEKYILKLNERLANLFMKLAWEDWNEIFEQKQAVLDKINRLHQLEKENSDSEEYQKLKAEQPTWQNVLRNAEFWEKLNKVVSLKKISEYRTEMTQFLMKHNITPQTAQRYKIGLIFPEFVRILIKRIGTQDLYLIGFMKKNIFLLRYHIVFPIFRFNDIVGFQGRTLENAKNKYVTLINLDVFPKRYLVYKPTNNKPEVVITEGIKDAIRMIELGYNAVALLGTALNSVLVDSFAKYDKIYIVADNDSAGEELIKKFFKLRGQFFHAEMYVVKLFKDPDEESELNIKYAMQRAESITDYLIKRYLGNSVEEVMSAINRFKTDFFSYLDDNARSAVIERFLQLAIGRYRLTNFRGSVSDFVRLAQMFGENFSKNEHETLGKALSVINRLAERFIMEEDDGTKES